MKKALVTGGNGFIGSHLVDLLLDKGFEVNILVRKGYMHPAYFDINDPKINAHLKNRGVKFFYGNLNEKDSLKSALKDVEYVFHVAGVAYPYHGLPDYVYYQTNVQGTKNLYDSCKGMKLKRFVYVSSIEAAGPSKDGRPLTEKSSRNPTDAYGRSKRDAELWLLENYKKDKIPVTIVRPPMTYGERSPLLERLFKYVKKGLFPMFGKGDASFEFCYVKNLVYGMYLAGIKEKAVGNIYFISEGSYKIIDVVNEIAKVMDVELKVIHIPRPIAYCVGYMMEILNKILPFYPFRGKQTGSPIFSRKSVDWITNDRYICSIEKIKKDLVYKPVYSREEGIRKTVKWYEEEQLI